MNNKGQAAIESLAIGILLVLMLFFVTRFGLMVQQNILVDELIEESLICLKQNKSDCAERLKNELQTLKFTQIELKIQNQRKIVSIKIKAVSAFKRIFEKESEIELDLST
jgi:hypothetical protein